MKTHAVTKIAQLVCDHASGLTFVGDRLLYMSTTDGMTYVVCDDEHGPVFDASTAAHLDIVGGKPLYRAIRDGKQFVVHGSHEGGLYDEIVGFWFSSDGSVAYQARDASDHLVVTNGVEGKRYPSVRMHGFSDGKAMYAVDVYARDRTKSGSEWIKQARERMVFGTDEGPICRVVLKGRCRPIIAEGRPIYGILHVDGTCSVVDGSKIGRPYRAVHDIVPHLVDGAPLYLAIGSRFLLVLGETEITGYDYIRNVSWIDGGPLYIAHEAGESFLMHGSRRFDYDCHIGPPRLVEGKPLFVGQTGGYVGDERPLGRFVVYGDTRGESYQDILWLEMIGGQPAYIASLPSDSRDYHGDDEVPRVCFVHGTRRGKVYTEIHDVTAAGGLPVYRATNGQGEWCVVVGAAEGYFCDHVFSLGYDAERREVTYGAVKDRTVYRVTVKV